MEVVEKVTGWRRGDIRNCVRKRKRKRKRGGREK